MLSVSFLEEKKPSSTKYNIECQGDIKKFIEVLGDKFLFSLLMIPIEITLFSKKSRLVHFVREKYEENQIKRLIICTWLLELFGEITYLLVLCFFYQLPFGLSLPGH